MGEVALSVMLVLIGGQLLGSFIHMLRTDTGFQGKRVLASVVLPEPERYKTPGKRGAVYQRFLDSVRAIPGVESAGIVDALPFSGENHGGFISVQPNSRLVAEIDIIGGDYLRALGVRLLAGRWFHEEEMQKPSGTALINDQLARRLWPGISAIGKRVCIDCTPEHPDNWKRVIGVVSGVRHMALDGPPPLNVYLAGHAFEEAAFLVVRTERPTAEMDKAVRRAIASIDPEQAVLLSASLQTFIDDSVADRRFLMTLVGITACLALVMASAGVYGVTSYMMSRRTQEIGIRMALGATARNVHTLLFRQGFGSVCAGLAIGLVLTLILMRALRGIIAGLQTVDVADMWIAACVVSLSAAAACWIPARRATRVDPMSALRQE